VALANRTRVPADGTLARGPGTVVRAGGTGPRGAPAGV